MAGRTERGSWRQFLTLWAVGVGLALVGIAGSCGGNAKPPVPVPGPADAVSGLTATVESSTDSTFTVKLVWAPFIVGGDSIFHYRRNVARVDTPQDLRIYGFDNRAAMQTADFTNEFTLPLPGDSVAQYRACLQGIDSAGSVFPDSACVSFHARFSIPKPDTALDSAEIYPDSIIMHKDTTLHAWTFAVRFFRGAFLDTVHWLPGDSSVGNMQTVAIGFRHDSVVFCSPDIALCVEARKAVGQ